MNNTHKWKCSVLMYPYHYLKEEDLDSFHTVKWNIGYLCTCRGWIQMLKNVHSSASLICHSEY